MPQPHPARPWGQGGGEGRGCGPVGTLASPGPGPSGSAGNSILWRTPAECSGRGLASPGLSPSAQVLWTCRDGFRRRQRETSWSRSLASSPPAPQALSCPGCSCIKLLISSCPRLGAERALGICHEAVGNFATVSRRASWKRGFPCHPRPLPQGLNREGGRKRIKCQWHLWY